VVFTVSNSGDGVGQVVDVAGGVPRSLCQNCILAGFLSDNRHALALLDHSHEIGLVDVTNGEVTSLIRTAAGELSRPHVSTDDRWLAFRNTVGTTGKSYVLPLNRTKVAAPEAAPQIQEPTSTGRPAGWSLDSRILYLLLDTDGFRCLWAQRIDAKGSLDGVPYVARHFHEKNNLGQDISTSFGNPITTDGFLFSDVEITGDVWRLVAPN
jgi:hypothetical protein